MVSACLLLLFYLFLTMLCQYSSNPLSSIEERICWFIAHHMFDFVLFLSALQSWIFFLCCCLCSSPLVFVFFPVLRLKDHSCLPFVVFTQRGFSSGSLPHAASLTAWVKRTDLPCIANVLRGNRLNYAHCRGEDIHNSAIKLLKVRRYLALQFPAVYRR